MKKPALIALCLLSVAGLLAAGWLARHDDAQAASSLPAPARAAGTAATRDAPPDSPQARTYRERQAFERQTRTFFAQAASLRAVERSERAHALSQQIDAYEQRNGLSAGEAVLLRTALVQATVDDPVRQAEQVAAIAERYRLRADQRMAAHAAQQQADPRFRAYKAREREVIAEVMASPTVPTGLTRDQYLRQRLQQERERAYAP